MALGTAPSRTEPVGRYRLPDQSVLCNSIWGLCCTGEESILHIWNASGVMQQLKADVFWKTKGKPYKFVLEPLNFADIVQSSNSRKRAVFKN